MQMLEELVINDNLLVSLPDNLGRLSRLRHIYAANNKIVGLPDSIQRYALYIYVGCVLGKGVIIVVFFVVAISH